MLQMREREVFLRERYSVIRADYTLTNRRDIPDYTMKKPDSSPSSVINVPLPWKQSRIRIPGQTPDLAMRNSAKVLKAQVPIMKFHEVTKIYTLESGNVTGIEDITLEILLGEFVAVMGPSGSGKSTLLNMMGCLDVPNSGEIWISGQNTRNMSDNQLTDLRLHTIGFIFQYFNLFPLFSALKNVHYPYVVRTGRSGDFSRAAEALQSVGLEKEYWHHRPNQLSGGQQQRVAIARSLVNDPPIILCDEPTGNLDTRTGTSIMELLSYLSHHEGRTIVMVTHDPRTAEYADRVIRIVDGRVEEDT